MSPDRVVESLFIASGAVRSTLLGLCFVLAGRVRLAERARGGFDARHSLLFEVVAHAPASRTCATHSVLITCKTTWTIFDFDEI